MRSPVYPPERGVKGRPLALAAIAAVHVLLLPLLFAADGKRSVSPTEPARRMLIVLTTRPQERQPRPVSPAHARVPSPRIQVRLPAPVPLATAAMEPLEAAYVIPEASVPIAGVIDAATIALRSAGAIDRQLRQELPDVEGGALTAGGDRLAAAIASAHVYRGGAHMEEIKLSDGRVVTKVVSSLGVYCMAMQSNAGAAFDPIRNGVKTVKVACPR